MAVGNPNPNISGAQVVNPEDNNSYAEVINAGSLRSVAKWPVKNRGTFVANGATPVVVPFAGMALTSVVNISLNTVGGSQGAEPVVTAIAVGVSFSVTCTAGDTSIYNFVVI